MVFRGKVVFMTAQEAADKEGMERAKKTRRR